MLDFLLLVVHFLTSCVASHKTQHNIFIDTFVLLESSTEFDGSTTFLTSQSPLPPTGSRFSLSTCFKQTPGNRGFLFANNPSSTQASRCFGVLIDGLNNRFEVQSLSGANQIITTSVSTSSPFNDGTSSDEFDDLSFRHFAVVVTPETTLFYLGGSQLGDARPGLDFSQGLCRDGVGFVGKRAPSNSFYGGGLSHVSLFGYGLSPSEVAVLNNCPGQCFAVLLQLFFSFTSVYDC